MAALDLSSKQLNEFFTAGDAGASAGDVRAVVLPAWCVGVHVFIGSVGGNVYDDGQSLSDADTITTETGIPIPANNAAPVYRGPPGGSWTIFVDSGGVAFRISPIPRGV